MADINTNVVVKDNLRVSKLRDYLLTIIDELLTDENYNINANMLSNDVNNYSLDKIPTETTIETWVTGDKLCRDVFSFRSRMRYSQDTYNNLINQGFFEVFENKIVTNNERGIMPNILNIQKIECLNCGTMLDSTTNSAEFDIQIQITYAVYKNSTVVSL